MATIDDIDQAKLALAEFEIRSAEQARQRLQEQHDASARWILTSLFSINAGAIVAIIGADMLKEIDLGGPLLLFFLGVLFSFAMAVSVQLADRKMVVAMHSWGQVWTTFLKTGEIVDASHASALAAVNEAESIGRRGRLFGLYSMLSWILASGWMLWIIEIGAHDR